MKGVTFSNLVGRGLRVGIVTARWNSEFTYSLRDGVLQGVRTCQVQDEDIVSIDVPGAYEVLARARYLIHEHKINVVVCIGVLIKGETDHYEYIAHGVSAGIAQLNISQAIPVIFGVLTCQTEEQARERSIGEKNHGVDWGKTAVEMAILFK